MQPKVLFLAPTIAAGSGGVADYSNLLALELTKLGLECHLASWQEEKAEPDTGAGRGGRLYLGRPGATPLEKCRKLEEYIGAFRIDWVSVQFVNYGFHPRGLAGRLGRALEPLAGICKWHLFFHELWLGEQVGADAYERCMGWLQRRQMLGLLDRLKPAAIWTSVGYYQRRLAEQNVPSAVVPIFGNFPFTEGREDDWLSSLANEGTGSRQNRERYYFAGIFGTVYPIRSFKNVIEALLNRANRNSQKLVFVLFGKNRCGPESIAAIRSLPGVSILQLGQLDPGRVDRVMRTMDIAVTTTPAEAVFKSGGAVAFLERGVPTIAAPGLLEGNKKPVIEDYPGLIIADDGLEQRLDRGGARNPPHPFLPAVADRYRKLFLEPPGAQKGELSKDGLH